MQIDFYALKRKVVRASYFEFVKAFWPTICTEPLVLNWHIEYLCNEIQENMERVFRGEPKKHDVVVNISPGTSKSSIFTVLMVPWAWTRMPGLRYIGTSFAEDLAYELSVKSRSVIQSPLYKALFPEVKLRPDVNNKGHWANTLGGDRYAVGTGGNITGRHAHVIGIDDPLDPTGGRSDAECLKATHYCCETLPSRKVNKETAWTYLVMQRISVGDPTPLFCSRPDVYHICLPGELTDDVTPKELRDKYVDGLFDITRLSKTVLARMKTELGEYGYAGQILQTPIPPGGGLFRVDNIITDHIAAPDSSEFTKIVRFWDKAASADRNDYTAGVKMGLHKDGSFWILDVIRAQWATDKREEMILMTAKKDGKLVRIGLEREPGSAGVDSARATVKMLAGYLVYPEPATGSKLLRADTFSVQVNVGNVHTAMRGKVWEDYINELMFFPNGKNDDMVDATSGAFSMLTQNRVKLGVLR